MGKKRKKQPSIGKIRDDAIGKTSILFLAALRDEFGFGEKRLVRVMETVNRYASHIDNNYIKLKEVQEIVEKGTGMKFKGW